MLNIDNVRAKVFADLCVRKNLLPPASMKVLYLRQMISLNSLHNRAVASIRIKRFVDTAGLLDQQQLFLNAAYIGV